MTTGPARALLRRLGHYLEGFSACFSRQPQLYVIHNRRLLSMLDSFRRNAPLGR